VEWSSSVTSVSPFGNVVTWYSSLGGRMEAESTTWLAYSVPAASAIVARVRTEQLGMW
jgi:hypothetical protein